MIQQIYDELYLLADEKIRTYVCKTTPSFPKERIIGTKVPELRRIAKNITSSDWRSFLDEVTDNTLEELMLQGFVIATAKMSVEERFALISRFVVKIDNWMVCDTFCNTLKPPKNLENEYFSFIQPYLHDDRAYHIRFGVVMLLSHFAKDEYTDAAFKVFNDIKSDDYYVKMAVAWAISVFFVKYPEKTMSFLKACTIDDFTYNKALQKITESFRVDNQTKSIIKKMKRHNTQKGDYNDG